MHTRSHDELRVPREAALRRNRTSSLDALPIQKAVWGAPPPSTKAPPSPLEEALLPAAEAETLAITTTNDAYDEADPVRVGAIFEHYRKDLQRIFASYAAADTLSADARGAQTSINLGELIYFAKDGNVFDDRLTVTKLSSIFVKVNAGDDGAAPDGAGDDGAADEDEQEVSYDEWLEVLARICCLKVGAAPGVGAQAWSKCHRCIAASQWGCLGADREPTPFQRPTIAPRRVHDQSRGIRCFWRLRRALRAQSTGMARPVVPANIQGAAQAEGQGVVEEDDLSVHLYPRHQGHGPCLVINTVRRVSPQTWRAVY